MVNIVPFESGAKAPPTSTAGVAFTKDELNQILDVYSRLVSDGKVRDYGIAFSESAAVFAIYRHSNETPLYSVEKRPKSKRHGPYLVLEPAGILRQGADLKFVLKAIMPKKLKSIDG